MSEAGVATGFKVALGVMLALLVVPIATCGACVACGTIGVASNMAHEHPAEPRHKCPKFKMPGEDCDP